MKYLLVACWSVAAGLAADTAILGKISWTSGRTTQVVVEISPGVRIDEHHQAGKLILDLHGVRQASKGSRNYKVDDGVIARIRVGDHPPASVRVVLDLETDAPAKVSRAATGAVLIQAPKGARLARASSPEPRRPPPAVPENRRPDVASVTTRQQDGFRREPPATSAPPPLVGESIRQSAGESVRQSVAESAIQVLPSMELTVLEDVAQDVPLVLQRYGGFIGFGPGQTSTIEKLFRSPDWSPAPVTAGRARLGDFFALQFTDNKSLIVEGLRKRHSIEPAAIAYALFPLAFVDTLHTEIRREAARQGRMGEVTAATMRFTMRGSGIDVKSVTIKP